MVVLPIGGFLYQIGRCSITGRQNRLFFSSSPLQKTVFPCFTFFSVCILAHFPWFINKFTVNFFDTRRHCCKTIAKQFFLHRFLATLEPVILRQFYPLKKRKFRKMPPFPAHENSVFLPFYVEIHVMLL